MTDLPRDRSFTNYVLLPDAQGRRIFLTPGPAGWSLPSWTEAPGRSWGAANDVNARVRELLGLEATLLRALPHDYSAAHAARVLEMENHSPGRAPLLEGRWVGRGELGALHLAASARDVLETWVAERAAGPPPTRAPWTRPGWFRTAALWMREQAAALGRRPSGAPVQERSWSISSIVRLPTEEGDLYLKASAPPFAHEAAVTAYLAGRYAAWLPRVLAVDPDRSWLLMEDFGGVRLQQVATIESWEEALRAMARMQVESVDRTDEMLASGLLDRRLAVLRAQVDPLLEYAASFRGRRHLSSEEREALAALAPRLTSACAELATAGVPATLDHGDCHAGNIAVRDGRPIFFDWSDACVAHPFLTLLPFLTFRRLPEAPDAPGRLIEAYLEPWQEYAPMPRLKAAYRFSRPLAALHQAVAYWRILTTVDPDDRWEWEEDLPYFLHQVLALAKEEW